MTNWHKGRMIIALFLVAVLLVMSWTAVTSGIPATQRTKSCLEWGQQPENYAAVISLYNVIVAKRAANLIGVNLTEGLEQEQPLSYPNSSP